MPTPKDAKYKIAQRETRERLKQPVRETPSEVKVDWVPQPGLAHLFPHVAQPITRNRAYRRAEEQRLLRKYRREKRAERRARKATE